MRRLLYQFRVLVLVLCCLAGSIQPAAAVEKINIQMHVVSTAGLDYQGVFFWQDAQLYVELATLKGMDNDVGVCYSADGNVLCLYRKMHPRNAIIPNPEILNLLYSMDEILVTDRGIFVPFTETMESLNLNPIADRAGDRLVILDAGNARELPQTIQEIYKEACYNMHYWKDSANYREDVVFAEIINSIRDRSVLSFITGEATYEGYREAFTKLIMPQSMEEADFSTGADETLGLMNNFFSFANDVTDFFTNEVEMDLMGGLKDTYKTVFETMDSITSANEVFKIEDRLELVAYLHTARVEEEGIIRALQQMKPAASGIGKQMESALDEVLDTYTGDDPVWVQVVDELSKKYFGSLDKLLVDQFVPYAYLYDVGNALTDFYLDTGDQLSATIQASRFLDIQTCCEQMFDIALSSYQNARRADKGKHLQAMVDTTKLYLRAGIKAQEAMARVDTLKPATDYAIERMKKEQKRMAQFTEDVIYYHTNFEAAVEWLVFGQRASKKAEPLPGLQPYTMADLPPVPTFITITWKEKVNDQRIHLTANITGTLDDGSNVHRVGNEGEYMANSELAATYSNYGKWIDLELVRTDSVLDVSVMHSIDTSYDAPGFADANVDIHIYNPLNTLEIIAANPAESAFADSMLMVDASHYLSSETGIGIATIRVDHGFPTILDSQKSEGWLDEQFTPDGQLQSSELYNADGYMLESRWYDYGECTAYTIWTYNEHNHLTRIRYANVMDPDEIQLIFENIYSDGVLQQVDLYNVFGTLLGSGATAADAADAVGMRMTVERSLPR